jgi:hypothetical protein
MKNEDCQLLRLDNNDTIIESNQIQDYLEKRIIKNEKYNREYYVYHKMTRNNRTKLECNNSKYYGQYDNQYKFHHNQYE